MFPAQTVAQQHEAHRNPPPPRRHRQPRSTTYQPHPRYAPFHTYHTYSNKLTFYLLPQINEPATHHQQPTRPANTNAATTVAPPAHRAAIRNASRSTDADSQLVIAAVIALRIVRLASSVVVESEFEGGWGGVSVASKVTAAVQL